MMETQSYARIEDIREAAQFALDELESTSATEAIADLHYAELCGMLPENISRLMRFLQFDATCAQVEDTNAAIREHFNAWKQYAKTDFRVWTDSANSCGLDVIVESVYEGILERVETTCTSRDAAIQCAASHVAGKLSGLYELAFELSAKCAASDVRDRIMGKHIEHVTDCYEAIGAFAQLYKITLLVDERY